MKKTIISKVMSFVSAMGVAVISPTMVTYGNDGIARDYDEYAESYTNDRMKANEEVYNAICLNNGFPSISNFTEEDAANWNRDWASFGASLCEIFWNATSETDFYNKYNKLIQGDWDNSSRNYSTIYAELYNKLPNKVEETVVTVEDIPIETININTEATEDYNVLVTETVTSPAVTSTAEVTTITTTETTIQIADTTIPTTYTETTITTDTSTTFTVSTIDTSTITSTFYVAGTEKSSTTVASNEEVPKTGDSDSGLVLGIMGVAIVGLIVSKMVKS